MKLVNPRFAVCCTRSQEAYHHASRYEQKPAAVKGWRIARNGAIRRGVLGRKGDGGAAVANGEDSTTGGFPPLAGLRLCPADREPLSAPSRHGHTHAPPLS